MKYNEMRIFNCEEMLFVVFKAKFHFNVLFIRFSMCVCIGLGYLHNSTNGFQFLPQKGSQGVSETDSVR